MFSMGMIRFSIMSLVAGASAVIAVAAFADAITELRGMTR